MKKLISVFLILAMLASLFAGLTLTADAAQPTSAAAVNYRTSSGYVYNWGKRDTVATFLTTYAQQYYTGSYSYATLSALSGSSASGTGFYSSALGTAIHNMLEAKQKSTTSYDGTKNLYKYTDCEENADKISSYYSGTAIGPNWGSSPTWNREHTWPNSKGLNGKDENDIMMLRPTAQSENGDRSNTAYGESGSYYDPNQNGQQLHGDVARLMLQHLMRWGNTSKFYGTGGVMESREVLLKWMIEDPVDTWEMGRNDAVQAITGVRNVFVDYPELAFKLLGATMPATYQTPSGGGAPAYTITAASNNNNYGTVTLNGSTITASPKAGYYAQGYTVTSGTASVVQNGNTFTVTPSTNCTVRINFAAKQSASLSFSVPAGVTTPSTLSGYSGDVKTLPTPSGTPSGGSYTYTFKGWVPASVKDATAQPATVYAAGSSYTLSGNTTLYALYSYFVEDGQGSSQTRWQLITDLTKFDAGTYALLTPDYKAFNGAFSSGNGLVTSSAFSFDASGYADTAPSGTLELTAEATTGGFRLYNESKGYLYTTQAKSGGLAFSSSEAKGVWTGEAAALKCVEGSVTAHLRTYANTSFRPYSSATTNNPLLLAKKVGGVSGTTYYTTSTGPACSHTYTSVVTQPTCTAAGYTTYTCSKCGDTYTGNETAALGHNYGSFSSNNNGTHSKTCSRCSDKVTESCSYTSSVSGATTTFTCSVCHYTYQTTAQTFTVRYNVLGTVTSTASCVEGQSVNLPATATAVDGFTFAGWVKNAINDETTSAPTVLTGSYKPTANTTLYALYTRTEAGGSGTSGYILSSAAPQDGDQIIIAGKNGSSYYAFKNDASAGGVSITVTDNVVTSPTTNLVWTVTNGTYGSNSGLSLSPSSNSSNYLHINSSALKVTTDRNNGIFEFTSAGSNTFIIHGKVNNKYLGFSSNSFSSASAGASLYIFKLSSGSGSTTYYTTNPTGETPHVHAYDSTGVCSCGEKLISIDSASLRLDEDIDVIYNVTVPEGATATMTFAMNGESTTITGDGSEGFVFEGVTPQCMGDNISATLSVTYGGKTYTCTKANYSVKTYCTDLLAKSTTTTKLRKLLSDTLAYGAAAQTYMSYKTNALVTSGVSGTSYSTFSPLSGLTPTFTGTAVESPCWIGAGLVLTNNVEMVFRFASPNKTGLSVKVTYNNKTTTFSGTSITAVSGMSGVYEVKLTGIKATDFGQEITAKFYKSSAQVGNTLGYSVNTYVCAKQNDSDTALKNLVRALYNYGASAASYAS